MKLNDLAWIDTCCADLLQWVEAQTPSGEWLRIKKKRVGGYLLTRFGVNKMPKVAEVEMSADEVTHALTQ